MTFNPNIPQPADIIATSQSQILINNDQLNEVYGTSGDHYAFDNTSPGEQNKHAKVTLPGLPTTNPPGNTLPTPPANVGVIFGRTDNAQTNPFWRRDTLTTDHPLLPIKAFGEFSVASPPVLTVNSFNVTDVTRLGAGNYQVNFTNALPDANYAVQLSIDMQTNRSGPIILYNAKTTTSVNLQLINQNNGGGTDGDVFFISFMVLRNN